MYRFLKALIILTLAIGFQTSYAAKDPTLRGLWLFDENKGNVTADSSENGNDGELSNCEWVEGKFGSALNFNGTNSCITIPHSESLSIDNDEISMTAWFTQDGSGAGTWHTIVCKGPYIGGQINENWAIFTNSSEKYICTTLTLKGGERWWTISSNGTVELDGEWHHFATTYNGNEVTYYLDGQLVITYPKNGDLLPNEEDMTIGCRSNDGIQWGGMLDEISIFNRVLSAEEIKNIMNKGLVSSLVVESAGKLATTWGELREN